WFEDARRAGLYLPEAVTLATATPDGVPSARMMLLKGFDERGFRFFTNYGSRKADELEANPRAALVFYWNTIQR
ncbi:MAG: pyridoxamine 5'-phosphate oxidase, partial [Gemmatimonadetes bacterium]|nr:pyridoxamine 5'-phosphate oxidase [Gemmatimonadota bacterium]NIS01675.1 pyridoxamine 5'-phosphate oxidase [Gemmatimonadota bacterium]NIT67409.1 pyridoxamine 5'-phosphate oxidase [Gemmatimonadota bacterium]NIU52839.1 pyridoxamine 5'-phosphate oxidase [Gemmatimonadota bacterium]NIV24136.1 pyridoxamine 5'-phosphate oxidase [Gemmatimonadota bacterium]